MNKEEKRAYAKRCRKDEGHKKKKKIYDKQYRKKNEDRIKIRNKQYQQENKDRINLYAEQYRREHREQLRIDQRRRLYGLTSDAYGALWNKQKGICPICTNILSSGTAYVDHNHNTGGVRGILCSFCNTMLGYAKENKDTLANAIKYLEERDTE